MSKKCLNEVEMSRTRLEQLAKECEKRIANNCYSLDDQVICYALDYIQILEGSLSRVMAKDNHFFFVTDVANRLPAELLPKTMSWSALFSAIAKLKTERDKYGMRIFALEEALDDLLCVAEKCDNWDSFPQKELNKAEEILRDEEWAN